MGGENRKNGLSFNLIDSKSEPADSLEIVTLEGILIRQRCENIKLRSVIL